MSQSKFSVSDISDSFQKLFDHMKGEKDPEIYASLAYIPFVGWIIPFFFRKNQDLCEFHSLQALKLNAGIACILFSVWLLKYFPIISWILNVIRFNPIVTDFLNYIAWILLFCLSVLGASKAYNKEKYSLPLMEDIESKVKEVFKRDKKNKT